MDYEVHASSKAERDLSNILLYVSFEKKNLQAALSINDDYLDAIVRLSYSANVLKPIDKVNGLYYEYRKIHFKKHNYYMVYHIEYNKVIIDRIYHDLQDPNNVE